MHSRDRTEDTGSSSERLQISLVVPVRDEAATIDELLLDIASQSRLPDEVIFVDGGSRDDTLARLRAFKMKDVPVHVIEAGEAMPGRGRNLGIAAATYDLIALADAGNRIEPTWLERLAEEITRDGSIDIVYGNFETITDSFFTRCAALVYAPVKQERDGERMTGPCVASCLLRRGVWKSVGGFPDLRASEDLIFIEAVEQKGFRTAWSPRATIGWRLRPDWSSTFRKFVSYSKHNVLAGRQRFWHYGIARQYAVGLAFIILAVAHSWWWLLAPVTGLVVRTGLSIWRRREARSLWWALNPLQFLAVLFLIVTIDAATFVGWLEALVQRGAKIEAPAEAAQKSKL